MKKIKIQNIILYIINFILIVFIIVSNKGLVLNNNRIILKNMSESTQVSDLNKSINELESSHEEYQNYIQTKKTDLATAITNAGVTTSRNDTFETITTNVSKILANKTNDATAAAGEILTGKTAYIKGTKITGTMTNREAWTSTPTSSGKVTIPAGFHNGSGYVDTSSVYTSGYNSGSTNKEKQILAFFAPNYTADWSGKYCTTVNYIGPSESYIIPQTGTYTFTIRVSRNYAGTGQLRWLKNGTVMNTYSCNGTTPTNTTIQVSLTKGDVITAEIYNSTENGKNTSVLKITL